MYQPCSASARRAEVHVLGPAGHTMHMRYARGPRYAVGGVYVECTAPAHHPACTLKVAVGYRRTEPVTRAG